MPFCKDCQFCEAQDSINMYWTCNCPKNEGVVSPLTGEVVHEITTCSILRKNDDHCGPIGKWFKAKEESKDTN